MPPAYKRNVGRPREPKASNSSHELEWVAEFVASRFRNGSDHLREQVVLELARTILQGSIPERSIAYKVVQTIEAAENPQIPEPEETATA